MDTKHLYDKLQIGDVHPHPTPSGGGPNLASNAICSRRPWIHQCVFPWWSSILSQSQVIHPFQIAHRPSCLCRSFLSLIDSRSILVRSNGDRIFPAIRDWLEIKLLNGLGAPRNRNATVVAAWRTFLFFWSGELLMIRCVLRSSIFDHNMNMCGAVCCPPTFYITIICASAPCTE